MHQYGESGFCLIWAVNNALQRNLLDKDTILRELKGLNKKNKNRNVQYYVNKGGLNFKSFKRVIDDVYGIKLKRVREYNDQNSYIVTYDMGGYLHTVAMVDGEILDSERESKITDKSKRVDIYKVIR